MPHNDKHHNQNRDQNREGQENSQEDTHRDGLYIQLFSIHGLIRSHDLELGRDADTGGQTKYMVELARALGEHEGVRQVDLFTRLIDDKRVGKDYSQPTEPLGKRARIVRIGCGGKQYRRKELLWPSLDEFVDKTLRFIRQQGNTPDIVHGHYADAGYVAMELAGFLGVPLVFTGHSLGRAKLKVLENAGLDEAEIDKRYHIHHRIGVEEEVMRKADLVIASTRQEISREYERYEAREVARFEVIPPGIEVDKFYPYYYDLEEGRDISEQGRQARVKMQHEINRFLNHPDKPLILAVSRPDRRKNIDGLVTAYGEDKELQAMANLAIFAGVRKDIMAMDDNEREVLTEMLLLMDKYDLYGKLALPKKHDPDTEIPVLYRLAAASGGVFVNPALTENFGITLIEASSSGLPVVSTDHGGPKDIIGHCRSGLLVDASDHHEISSALKQVLADEERWREYANNGVNGVREHYAWDAHTHSYLEHITPLLKGSHGESGFERPRNAIGAIGQHLKKIDKLIICDLDATLLGDDQALAELAARLREHPTLGFGLVTRRTLEDVRNVLEANPLPTPDIVVSAAGSEIHYAPDFAHDRGYERHISYGWKPTEVHEALVDLDFLTHQEDEQHPFKVSYSLDSDKATKATDKLSVVRGCLDKAKLHYHVVYTATNRVVDILPHRASSGKATRYLSYKWSLPAEQIAVTGDSGNDTEMLRGAFQGIVVGNLKGELEGLRGQRRVYFAKARHARGVLEGLEHYGFITH